MKREGRGKIGAFLIFIGIIMVFILTTVIKLTSIVSNIIFIIAVALTLGLYRINGDRTVQALSYAIVVIMTIQYFSLFKLIILIALSAFGTNDIINKFRDSDMHNGKSNKHT